jgi:hypothetical protein
VMSTRRPCFALAGLCTSPGESVTRSEAFS